MSFVVKSSSSHQDSLIVTFQSVDEWKRRKIITFDPLTDREMGADDYDAQTCSKWRQLIALADPPDALCSFQTRFPYYIRLRPFIWRKMIITFIVL